MPPPERVIPDERRKDAERLAEREADREAFEEAEPDPDEADPDVR